MKTKPVQASRVADFQPTRLIPVVGLLVLAFIGYIKGSKYLAAFPVNPTTIAVVVVWLWVLPRIPGRPYLQPRRVLLLAAFFGSLLLGVRSPDNSYMTSKLSALALIVPALLLGGAYLLRDERARRMWLWANVAYGAVVLLIAYVNPQINATSQLATAGGNAIGSGRATGAALTVLGVFLLFNRRHRFWALCGMALMAYGVTSAAERGPALAAVVAIVITAALAPGRGKAARVTLITTALVALGWWLVRGGFVGQHLTASGDVSSTARLRLWGDAWNLAWTHPFGVGWGGLFDALPTPEHLSSGYAQYPHNVLLEVASEAGLLTAAIMLVLVVVSFRAQRLRASTPTEAAMLALFLFFIVNAMVSSDATGNRGLWVSVGAAFAVAPAFRARTKPVKEHKPAQRKEQLSSR